MKILLCDQSKSVLEDPEGVHSKELMSIERLGMPAWRGLTSGGI